jgi:hypothetical protein
MSLDGGAVGAEPVESVQANEVSSSRNTANHRGEGNATSFDEEESVRDALGLLQEQPQAATN